MCMLYVKIKSHDGFSRLNMVQTTKKHCKPKVIHVQCIATSGMLMWTRLHSMPSVNFKNLLSHAHISYTNYPFLWFSPQTQPESTCQDWVVGSKWVKVSPVEKHSSQNWQSVSSLSSWHGTCFAQNVCLPLSSQDYWFHLSSSEGELG